MSTPGHLDEAALATLYTRLEKRVYNVVYRWVWQQDDAAEIVQEAFLRLWNMRARVDMTTVDALVFKIAVNLAANRRRSRKLWQLISLEGLGGHEADARADVAAHVEQGARNDAVRRVLDTLPERLRRVVVLTELSELSYREVAVILGVPEGTVGSRRNKALAILREHLADSETLHAAT